jgi:hypothetical protein
MGAPNPFPIYINIPSGPNDPADDQPLMQINNANINSYVSVDHVAPNATGNGYHQKITFNSTPSPVPGTIAIVNPLSVEYTNVGVADPSFQQLYWQNALAIFPLSAIRAFGVIALKAVTGGSTVTLLNGFNVASVAFSIDATKINVNLVHNCVAGTNITVLLNIGNISAGTTSSSLSNWTYTPETLSITYALGPLTPPNGSTANVSFLILQI